VPAVTFKALLGKNKYIALLAACVDKKKRVA